MSLVRSTAARQELHVNVVETHAEPRLGQRYATSISGNSPDYHLGRNRLAKCGGNLSNTHQALNDELDQSSLTACSLVASRGCCHRIEIMSTARPVNFSMLRKVIARLADFRVVDAVMESIGRQRSRPKLR
jgi:hypothetical protein